MFIFYEEERCRVVCVSVFSHIFVQKNVVETSKGLIVPNFAKSLSLNFDVFHFVVLSNFNTGLPTLACGYLLDIFPLLSVMSFL